MKYKLEDLIDFPRLRELLGSFDEIHSMPSAIIDNDGNILIANAWQDICTKFHRIHPETEKKCIESDIFVRSKLDGQTSHVVYRCPMGLVDSAIPLIIDGEHLGNVFTGQLFIDPPDESSFIDQAHRYGFNKTEYLTAMRKVPYFTEAHMIRNLAFIHKLVMMLAEQELHRKRLIEAQETLIHSETMLKEAQRIARMGNWELDLKTNRLFWSDEVYRLFEIEPDAFPALSESFLESIHPDDRDAVNNAYTQSLENRMPYEVEHRLLMKDGRIKYMRERCETVYAPDGHPLRSVGTVQDITEQKKAEQELQNKSEELDRYFTSSLDLLCIADTGGHFLRLNPEWEKVLGYPTAELEGRVFLDFVHPEDMESTLAAISKLDTQEDVRLFVNRYRCKDSSYRWIEWRSHPVGNFIYAVARDITERKLAEEDLKNALLFNRHIIDSAQEGIIVFDRDLHYQMWNPYMERLTGLKFSDVLGKTPYDFQFMMESGIIEDLKKVLDGRMVEPREFQDIIPETGRNGWVVHANTPLLDSSGEIIGILGMVRDITEQKKTADQLHQAQKMESIGRLAGGVAHDFNNMLSVIIGNAELGLMCAEDTDPLHECLVEIKNAADRSSDLTRQLLTFARKQAIQPQVMNLNDTVSSMLRMLQRLIGEDIKLTWQAASDIWSIKMDPSQVDQILANLCINARDAIQNTGKIMIETHNRSVDAFYCEDHIDAVPGDYVRLSVSDDGIGMDKDTLTHIFEPFFTTKELGKGTGLGMATVYGIARQNDGFINVYSEPGKGTTFSIYLPRFEEASTTSAAENAVSAIPKGYETVLVVEDESAILKMTAMMLGMHGYTVLTASTPGKALDIADEHAGTLHLLMTDVIMPEMNGGELAQRLMINHPAMKILFMSGYTSDIIGHHGVLDNDVNFIQKPFSMRDLAAKVRGILDKTKKGEFHA